MDQPTTCKECGSQNVETGWAIGRYQALKFKTGPRIFDPTRPVIAIACLEIASLTRCRAHQRI